MSEKWAEEAILTTNVWMKWKGIKWAEIQDDFSLFKMGNVSLNKRSEVFNCQTTLVHINWGRVYIATELEMCIVDSIYKKEHSKRWYTNNTEKHFIKNPM